MNTAFFKCVGLKKEGHLNSALRVIEALTGKNRLGSMILLANHLKQLLSMVIAIYSSTKVGEGDTWPGKDHRLFMIQLKHTEK